MDNNDISIGLVNIINEGEAATKRFLSLVNEDALNLFYDWLDEYLVEKNNEGEDGENEYEEEDEE